MEQVFVSRQAELKLLREFLDRAMNGRGQICFVTGEAGLGKTSLTAEFARHAQREHQDLLIAVGNCNAQTGIGDPYLPFREVLGLLTGDVEDKLAQGAISSENATRLSQFLRVSKNLLIEVGPDLIDILVPGSGLAARVSKHLAQDTGWLKRLEQLRGRGHNRDVAVPRDAGADQGRIFEQVTTLFRALSRERPMVLILDDLQWIDESSAALLFHLARRIDQGRLLIIGSYRPEDVALGRAGQRHPLAPVLAELKREFGEVMVTLGDEDDGEVRGFVDALLDTEANRLGEQFRAALARHTRGQPLFTTELLRAMQERGDLVRDAQGHWTEGTALDWRALPARVEGVIEQRISRLREELQQLLTIASVEGEAFTAQVVASVGQHNERQVIKFLSQELEKLHRLVREDGMERLDSTRLSRFRFRHNLFQQYLYHALGSSERELLHEDVAAALEQLYAGQTEEVAVHLARHFLQAHRYERAATYYLQAGRRAMRLYADAEAITLLRAGVDTLNALRDPAAQGDLLLELQLAIGEAQFRAGQVPESMATFRAAADLAVRQRKPEALARAALGYEDPRWRFNLPAAPSIELLRKALQALSDADSVLRVRLLAGLARAGVGAGSVAISAELLDEAVAMARRLDDPRAVIEALQRRVNLDRDPRNVARRIGQLDEMLGLARALGDRHLVGDLVAFRSYEHLAIGDLAGWQQDIDEGLRIGEEINEPFHVFMATTMRVAQLTLTGRFREAEELAQSNFANGSAFGIDNADGVLGTQMFTIRRLQGRLHELAPVVQHFVNDHGRHAAWQPGLALIYAELGMEDEARALFERLADDDFAAIPDDALWQTCMCFLAGVCAFLRDTRRAQRLLELLQPYAELSVVVGNATACLGAASCYLGQLCTTLDDRDAAEFHFLRAIELNTRMHARPWLAHTQFHYAQLLRARNLGDDDARAAVLLDEALATARELGLQGIVRRIG